MFILKRRGNIYGPFESITDAETYGKKKALKDSSHFSHIGGKLNIGIVHVVSNRDIEAMQSNQQEARRC